MLVFGTNIPSRKSTVLFFALVVLWFSFCSLLPFFWKTCLVPGLTNSNNKILAEKEPCLFETNGVFKSFRPLLAWMSATDATLFLSGTYRPTYFFVVWRVSLLDGLLVFKILKTKRCSIRDEFLLWYEIRPVFLKLPSRSTVLQFDRWEASFL